MKIGLFGGTFNPPHNAHVKIAEAFFKQFELDKLYICPANIPYHKSSVIPLDAQHRLNMTRLAFSNLPTDRVVVSDMEIARGGNTFTIDTVNEILSRHSDCDKVYFLCGSDMIKTLPSWRKADELFTKARFVHARRNDEENLTLEGAELYTLDIDEIDISSTEIRLDTDKYIDYLPNSVYKYIKSNLLYDSVKEYDLKEMTKYAMTHEKESRFLHTLAVEECALELKTQNAPQLSDNTVSAAAILHDCTKNCEISNHYALFSTLEDPLPKEDLSSEKLLHSRSGAIFAKREFNVTDSVYNSIWRHTVGASEMSVLDKIIFLADFIENTRTYDECVALRKTYYNGLRKANTLILRLINLNKCVKMAIESTIAELEEKGVKPHPETLAALENIKLEISEYENVFGKI